MLLQKEREELAAAGRRLAAAGLVIGTSGNLSVRAGDLVAVTPTGGVISELTAADMTVIDFDGTVVDGELAPTSEVPMHLAIYRASFAAAIAHTHAVTSTAIANTLDELPVVHYGMLSLGGSVRVADYACYGTDELAANVTAALDGKMAALMRNHGSIALGSTIAKAVDNLQLLEWSAELYAKGLAITHATGREARILTQAEQETVIMAALSTGYGATKKIEKD